MNTHDKIIESNKKQVEFYNQKSVTKNLPTRIWYYFREQTLKKIRKDIGILNESYDIHKVWFGDLSGKKVLDLGCYEGNYWSLYLAEHSKEYIALDLSDVAIKKLAARIQLHPNAQAIVADFLSEEFVEKDFDMIYAYGVLHHFQNTDVLIDKLNEKLAPDGIIISYDPLETSLPIKIMRMLYRPFQSDAAWEWPFKRKTFYQFQKSFTIVERRGILGKSKWVALLNFMPLSEEKKKRIGQKWYMEDWEQSKKSDKVLFRCMHLTMLLKKK